MFRVALFLMKSKTLAEDVTQETFIQVYKKYYLYNLNKPIEPWIYRITINTARNMCRKNKWLSFFGHYQEQESGDLIEETFFKLQERTELWCEINKLSLKSREVIVLHYYLGMKLNEVSAILNIPLGTCKSRLNFALSSLRKNINENVQINFVEGGEYNGAI